MKYEGTKEYRPISPWGYIGYMFLYSIPIIGFLFLIIFSFSDKRINRRNFARSYFCLIILSLILIIIAYVLGFIDIYYFYLINS